MSGGSGFQQGMKVPMAAYTGIIPPPPGSHHGGGLPHPSLGANIPTIPDVQRAQMMEFSHRLRNFGMPYGAAAATAVAGHPHLHNRVLQVDPLFYLYGRQDPRMGFFHEEPKPSHSYIGLIGMAILQAKEKKLVLSDIYQWILDNYPYFRTRGPGWRNSIRHNLSLNDCFIKAGRAANGKGHYWAVHPAVVDDFEKGDFRRRRAQRKVRKAMGLAVPDEEDSPSPPPPCTAGDVAEWRARFEEGRAEGHNSPPTSTPVSPDNCVPKEAISNGGNKPPAMLLSPNLVSPDQPQHPPPPPSFLPWANLSPLQWKQMQQNLLFSALPLHHHQQQNGIKTSLNQLQLAVPALAAHACATRPEESAKVAADDKSPPKAVKRRAFDVESLLAPDTKRIRRETGSLSPGSSTENISQPEVSLEEADDNEESDVDVDDIDCDVINFKQVVSSTPKGDKRDNMS